MNDVNTNNQTNTQSSDLAGAVLKRIEAEHILPTPRWQFIFSNCFIWVLWIVSGAVGALSVAFLVYVYVHTGYALHEATHESWFEFYMETLPWVWFLLFVTMAVLSYVNFRKTEKGYRYPLWQILSSSLLVSVAGGMVLHSYGAGIVIEKAMEHTVPTYPTLAKLEQKRWQHPESGHLLGRMIDTNIASGTVLFIDIDNQPWHLTLEELNEHELSILVRGDLVRLLGIMSSTTDGVFYGCGVFPWMYQPSVRAEDMRKEREVFLGRMKELRQRVTERSNDHEADPFASSSTAKHTHLGLCPMMPLVKKIPL